MRKLASIVFVATALLLAPCAKAQEAAPATPPAATAATPPAAEQPQEKPAKKMAYSGFSGGMFLHTGYMFSDNVPYTVAGATATDATVHQRTQGVPFGIGGCVKFRFGRHLRIGGEGYVTNLTYGKNKSHATVGWGGALIDCVWDLKHARLFIGGIVGGGSQRNVVILEPTGNDLVTDPATIHRKYGFMALDPFFGAEFPLSRRIALVLKTDWLFNVSNPQPDYFTGPRLFVGILFGHSK